jgi:hypothetical protein
MQGLFACQQGIQKENNSVQIMKKNNNSVGCIKTE